MSFPLLSPFRCSIPLRAVPSLSRDRSRFSFGPLVLAPSFFLVFFFSIWSISFSLVERSSSGGQVRFFFFPPPITFFFGPRFQRLVPSYVFFSYSFFFCDRNTLSRLCFFFSPPFLPGHTFLAVVMRHFFLFPFFSHGPRVSSSS